MEKRWRVTNNLAFRIIASIIFLLLVFSTIVSGIGYFRFTHSIVDEYSEFSYRISQTAASYIDADQLDHYLECNGDDESWRSTNELLDGLCQTQGTTFIYAIEVDPDYDAYTVVFNVTASDSGYSGDDVWTIGHVQATSNDDYKRIYEDIYENGLERETLVRDTNLNGADPHLNTLAPLRGSDGEVKGIIAVQISMDDLVASRKVYLRWVAATLAGLVVISSVCAWIFFNQQIIGPVQAVTKEARRFALEATPAAGDVLENISRINEIEMLASSIDKMESDTLAYIDNITAATAEKERIGTELSLATRIQADMLPSIFPAFPSHPEFDIYASMSPAKAVGGDFYDFFLIDDDHVALVIADVSGKGVPAALFMMVSKILLKNFAMTGTRPSIVLEVANKQICANNREEMFVTVWLGILEISTGKLIAANAGHEYPVLKRPDGPFEVIKDKHGLFVGGMEGICYKDYELQLEPGSKLFVYTDGLVEATNADGEQFGMRRAVEVLNRARELSPEEIIEEVDAAVDAFVGEAEQFDDLTMMCVEYRGPRPAQDPAIPKITVDAVIPNVDVVTDFVNAELEAHDCPFKVQMQLDVAIDEVFANIARYAYGDGVGTATVRVEHESDPRSVTITFIDSGIPYDPLQHEDPDTTLPAKDREPGGLGIFIVKKTMDDMTYERVGNENVLRIKKLY